MKIRSTSVAVLAAVPLVIAGCSQTTPAAQQAPPPKPPQPAPVQVKPEGVAWADQICGLVGGFSASQRQGPQVDKTNTGTFKASSIAQMDSAEKSATNALDGLKKLGPSPIAGADRVNDSFQTGFVQVRDVLHAAKTKAEQVDVSNQQAFTSGMTAVQEELKKGQAITFDAQFAEFSKNTQLTAAAGQAPSCKALSAPPPQPNQPPR
jgi:hypothetical protein